MSSASTSYQHPNNMICWRGSEKKMSRIFFLVTFSSSSMPDFICSQCGDYFYRVPTHFSSYKSSQCNSYTVSVNADNKPLTIFFFRYYQTKLTQINLIKMKYGARYFNQIQQWKWSWSVCVKRSNGSLILTSTLISLGENSWQKHLVRVLKQWLTRIVLLVAVVSSCYLLKVYDNNN